MYQPPFRLAQLPALIGYICRNWHDPRVWAPIDFGSKS